MKIYKLGIIGFGGMANWHRELLQEIGRIEIAGVYDFVSLRIMYAIRSYYEIMNNLNDTVKELFDSTDKMSENTSETTAATRQITDAIGEMAGNITGQAQDTEVASNEVQKLLSIVEKNSVSAQNLTGVSNTIRNATTEGMSVVNELQVTTNKSQSTFA